MHLGLHFDTDRQWNRIEVGQHLHAAAGVHMRKVNRGQIEAFFQWCTQVFSLQVHALPDRLGPVADDALFIVLGSLQQKSIEFFPTAHLRHGHQVVPAKITAFSFDTSLLVALCRCTELRLEPPVRSEGDESRGLLSLVSSQNLFHRTLEVVVTKSFENSRKISERPFVRFQKRLLAGVREGAMESSSAGHAPHAKYVGQLSLSADIRVSFIPVHLRLSTPSIGLRNERLLGRPIAVESSAPERIDESRTPQRRLLASPLGSGTRSGARCAAAFVALFGLLPESPR